EVAPPAAGVAGHGGDNQASAFVVAQRVHADPGAAGGPGDAHAPPGDRGGGGRAAVAFGHALKSIVAALSVSVSNGRQRDATRMPGLSQRRRLGVLAICCASILVVVMDISIVNVALPAMRRELHAPVSSLQWTIDAYTLVLASFLVLA